MTNQHPHKFSTTPYPDLFLEQLDNGQVRLFRTNGDEVGIFQDAEAALKAAQSLGAKKKPQKVTKLYSVTITRSKMEG